MRQTGCQYGAIQ